MGIRFYDEAIVEKIKGWISDPNLLVLKPNEVSRLWQIRDNQKNDEPLTLPLIAISRDSNINVSVTTRRPLTFNGVKVDGTPLKTLHLDGIPVDINYQIDIYTKEYEAGDEYLRSMIFNLVNHPTMYVHIPYNGSDIQHVCNLRLDNSVIDNSDITEKMFPDQFTRWTLKVTANDAYLFNAPITTNKRIIGAVVNVENTSEEDVTYVEESTYVELGDSNNVVKTK